MARSRISISGWRLGTIAVVVACGALLVVSAQASGGSDLRAGSAVELVDLVKRQDEQNQELTDRVDELTVLIEELRASSSTEESEEVQAAIDDVSLAAGLVPVEGPGLMIELSDAELPDDIPPDLNTEDYLVHQQDVEGVLNALWAGGAESVMVMGQRIISTSTVQCEGPVLVLNGRAFYQPFTIHAIGNVLDLQEALDESPAVAEYRNYADVLGLGFELEVLEEISMPAYDGGLGVTVGE